MTFLNLDTKSSSFGGSLLNKSNAKTARPISTKKVMHLVLRSEKAKGAYSFLLSKHKDRIEDTIYNQARKTGVKVYSYANSGNHLHILVLPRTRRAFSNFIRAICGIIARIVLGKERGQAQHSENSSSKAINPEKFWDQRPFSRILEWGKAFNLAKDYLLQNTLEALGFIKYKPRKAQRYSARRRAPS